MKTPLASVILALLAFLPALPQQSQPVNAKAQITASASTVVSSGASTTTIPQPAAPGPIVLPIEVFGSNGTTASAAFEISRPVAQLKELELRLKISGLEYDSEASVKINDSRWLPIDTANVMLSKNAAAFGGIGGGFHTFRLKLRLPIDCVVSGANTIVFRFNRTNSITSGYRILGFNIESAGVDLLPSAAFADDDPSKWQAPLNDAADISAGRTLWNNASLKESVSGATIKARCSDCHAQDGRDLKYFNYSNLSIRTRAMFHGLTAQQGDQIASYIRTLNVPTSSYARPWNPPYQPGPGLDSRPVSDWAAGAGIDAVLDNDADTLSYIMPGGNTAKLAHNAYLNQREIPIALQLLDWNHWLPTVHPMDAFGSQFTASGLATGYSLIRSELKGNDPKSYQDHYKDIVTRWLTHQNSFHAAVRQPQSSSAWNDRVYAQAIYSAAQWLMVKSWEINQDYGLEGMSQAIYGPQAADRAWYTDQAFLTSPFMLKIPRPSAGIGNGSRIAYTYDSFIWYQTQLILDDGNGAQLGTFPIDRGYALAYLHNDLTWDGAIGQVRVGTAGLMMEWMTKILQTRNDPEDSSPYSLLLYPGIVSTWSEVSRSQKVQFMNAWVSAWTTFVQGLSAEQLFTAPPGVTPTASPTFNSLQPGSFTGDLAWSLPRLAYEGVDPQSLKQVAKWASGFWPAHDWMADLNQTCRLNSSGQITQCQ
jgi:cytochrome c553